MAGNYCKACKHFLDAGHALGVCRRYPQFQNRSPNEVCGEFSSVLPVPEILALPVVEMTEEKPKRKYTKRGTE